MIKVFLVEPVNVYRGALSRALEGQHGIRIVGEAASAADALRAIRLSGTSDVLVVVSLDSEGPGEELQNLRRIKQEFPMIPVLATAPAADNVIISHALYSGADSFLPQDRDITELIDSIRRTADGEAIIATSRRKTNHRGPSGGDGVGAQLTERELQVLRLAGAGLTARQIARELSVQERTVTTHLQHIYRKLRVSNRVAALRAATRAGILGPSSVGDEVLGRMRSEA
jgi:two-component system, NarL family, response regulator DevR